MKVKVKRKVKKAAAEPPEGQGPVKRKVIRKKKPASPPEAKPSPPETKTFSVTLPVPKKTPLLTPPVDDPASNLDTLKAPADQPGDSQWLGWLSPEAFNLGGWLGSSNTESEVPTKEAPEVPTKEAPLQTQPSMAQEETGWWAKPLVDLGQVLGWGEETKEVVVGSPKRRQSLKVVEREEVLSPKAEPKLPLKRPEPARRRLPKAPPAAMVLPKRRSLPAKKGKPPPPPPWFLEALKKEKRVLVKRKKKVMVKRKKEVESPSAKADLGDSPPLKTKVKVKRKILVKRKREDVTESAPKKKVAVKKKIALPRLILPANNCP
eukprot:Blabericola_migrator_1__12580@NODE_7_length_25668_cov_124_338502_g6_i0_p8_GENE_NODE_7_length_25668_cov_124_338502_g6_i0NODE_7_length_25668_cov_124_338502_g6_i0_p8_ORF_typecomplete_len320_score76_29_NODE_7_length_25668_cov_124_338502_g6_i072498208